MIKAIIFDFFGVLVTERFKRFCDEYFPDDKSKRKKAVDLVRAHDAGLLSQKEYIQDLAELANVSLATVQTNMHDNHPNDLLLKFIRNQLKPNYKIGVLSNSGDDYLSAILAPEDVALFDDIVLSYRYGMVKPQAEIFEFAAKRLGVEAKESVFVDDSPTHCEGARRAGMEAILYSDFTSFKKRIEKILAASPDN